MEDPISVSQILKKEFYQFEDKKETKLYMYLPKSISTAQWIEILRFYNN